MISLRFLGVYRVTTAEGKRLAMPEVRNNWEGQVINGVFPLRRFLGASDHSWVFLTESRTEGFFNAAIKIVPADPALSEVQLWHWKTAATFSHPHLIRLLDSGQWEIEGRQFLFVVMEYAEETLSQILPYRALAPDEVRELLVPTLDALAFLHRDNWVQGQLKPSNFLVVNDQLKLATDTIRPIALSTASIARPSIYDPPESETGEDSAAGDIWALGVTLVEALTQYPPTWLAGRSEPPTLPTNLPPTFAETVHRCLSRNPADRPTVPELHAQTRPVAAAAPQSGPSAPVRQQPVAPAQPVALAPQPEPVIRAEARPLFDSPEEQKRSRWVPTAAALLVIILVAVWGGSRLFHGQPKPPQSPETLAQASSPPSVSPASSDHEPPVDASPKRAEAESVSPRPMHQRRQSSAAASSSAVHQEIPNVPRSARETIHGHVKVGVRVSVDRSGRVVRESLDSPGPSRYFNRLASEAARKWKFAPADDQVSREWLLRFEFGRDGTTVHAVRARS
jgi:TonB family protein